jgi:hypothetical protein
MDETWNHVYDPEAKEQSKDWRHSGILLVDYLEKGATITEKYYVELLYKMKQELVSKRRGKLSK